MELITFLAPSVRISNRVRAVKASEGQLFCFLIIISCSRRLLFSKCFTISSYFEREKRKARVKYCVLQQTIERYPSVRVAECDVKLEGKYHMASKSYHFGRRKKIFICTQFYLASEPRRVF